jgi:hypothetical protein
MSRQVHDICGEGDGGEEELPVVTHCDAAPVVQVTKRDLDADAESVTATVVVDGLAAQFLLVVETWKSGARR